jgi:hypothetical protein
MRFLGALKFTIQMIKIRKSIWIHRILYASSIILAACTPVQYDAYKNIKNQFQDVNQVIVKTPLVPHYKYLRIWLNEQPALLVLGYTEIDQTMVWYSSDLNVFRTRMDRYAGSTGFIHNWENVSMTRTMSWEKIVEIGQVRKKSYSSAYPRYPAIASYTRKRDVMPRYEFGITEDVAVYQIPQQPQKITKAASELLQGKNLLWFTEVLENPNTNDSLKIQGFFAVERKSADQYELVFGQQCLQENYCIAWMPWSSSK